MAVANAELRIYMRMRDEAQKQLRATGKELSKTRKQLQGLRQMSISLQRVGGIVGALGLGSAIAGLGHMGIQFNVVRETAELAFASMLGSGEAAVGMLDDLTALTRRVPFQFEELVPLAQRLTAYGFSAERIIPTLEHMSDAAAAMGGGGELLNRVGMALGQILTRGKLASQELLQLSEAGIPGWRILMENLDTVAPKLAAAVQRARDAGRVITDTKVMEKLQEMVSGGLIEAGPALEALLAGISSRFGGLAATVAETTTTGAFSNLISALRSLAGELAEPAFEDAADILRSLAIVLDTMSSGWQLLPEDLQTALSWIGALTLGLVGLGTAIAGITLLLGGTGLTGSLLGLVGTVGPIALVIAGVTALGIAWGTDFGGMRSNAENFLSFLGPWAPNVVAGLGPIGIALGILTTAWNNDWLGIRSTLESVWNNTIKPILDTLAGHLNDLLAWAGGGITALWNSAWGSISEGLERAWEIIGPIILPLWEALNNIITAVRDRVSIIFSAGLQWVSDTVRVIYNWITGVTNPKNIAATFAAAVTGLTGTVKLIYNWIAKITTPRNIAATFAAAVSGLTGAVKTIYDWITGIAVPAIAATFEAAVTKLTGIARTLFNWLSFATQPGGIDAIFQAGVIALTGIPRELYGWMTGRAVPAIKTAFNTGFAWLSDIARTIYTWLTGRLAPGIATKFNAGVQWIGTVANTLYNWIKGQGVKSIRANFNTGLTWLSSVANQVIEFITGEKSDLSIDMNLLVKSASAIWSWIEGTVTTALDRGLKIDLSGAGAVWNWISQTVAGPLDRIVKLFWDGANSVGPLGTPIWDWVQGKGSLRRWLKLDWLGEGSLWDWISNPVGTLLRTISTELSKDSGTGQDIWNWVSGAAEFLFRTIRTNLSSADTLWNWLSGTGGALIRDIEITVEAIGDTVSRITLQFLSDATRIYEWLRDDTDLGANLTLLFGGLSGSRIWQWINSGQPPALVPLILAFTSDALSFLRWLLGISGLRRTLDLSFTNRDGSGGGGGGGSGGFLPGAAQSFGGGGNTAPSIVVNVTVNGSVLTERELTRTLIDAIRRESRLNGAILAGA